MPPPAKRRKTVGNGGKTVLPHFALLAFAARAAFCLLSRSVSGGPSSAVSTIFCWGHADAIRRRALRPESVEQQVHCLAAVGLTKTLGHAVLPIWIKRGQHKRRRGTATIPGNGLPQPGKKPSAFNALSSARGKPLPKMDNQEDSVDRRRVAVSRWVCSTRAASNQTRSASAFLGC